MDKQLARYLADFNRPGYAWQYPREEPGLWSTVIVVVAILATITLFWWEG